MISFSSTTTSYTLSSSLKYSIIIASDLNAISASLDSNMPGVAILISQVQTLLNQAQDVMEGLKNNPLIKNGVSVKPEKESATPKLREDNF